MTFRQLIGLTTLTVSAVLGCTAIETGGPEDTDNTRPASDVPAVTVHEGMGSILVVNWTQSETKTAWLEFSVDEGEWLSSPPTERGAGAAKELVLGAPFETQVQVKLVWEGGESEIVYEDTGALPDGAPRPTLVEGDPSGWDAASPYVLLCMQGEGDWGGEGSSKSLDGAWTFIIDRQGRTVWAKALDDLRMSLFTQLGYNGDSILIDQSSFWTIFDGGDASRIERVNIEGEVLESWDTPGQHHPFTELPDGTIAWAAVDEHFTDEELKTLSPDGTERTLWSCQDFLNEEANGGEPGGYCGSNSLSYSTSTDTFLYSSFALETIIEIEAETGDTVRYFGHTGENAWTFDPPESAFWWQHGSHYTEEGNLLLSSKGENAANETVVIEYALDEEAQTLVEVFRLGEGAGLYGEAGGEADYTVGGHILHNLGSRGILREYTPDGETVWSVEWDTDALGRSTPLPDLYW
jgi:hypothetical protein